MQCWLMAVDRIGRYTGSWSYIQGSTCNHENEGKTNNLVWMLYSMYAVLGINLWSWHGEIERNDLTFCSVIIVELWTRKREMGMKMRIIWRIRVDMRNQGYDMPDRVGKTSYQSATTLVSVRNTQVFRTALMALTEPRTLWRRITRYPSPRRRVALHTYSFTLWWCLRTIRRTCVLHSSQGLQLCWSRLHNAWRC